jgi:hypothetical protein
VQVAITVRGSAIFWGRPLTDNTVFWPLTFGQPHFLTGDHLALKSRRNPCALCQIERIVGCRYDCARLRVSLVAVTTVVYPAYARGLAR